MAWAENRRVRDAAKRSYRASVTSRSETLLPWPRRVAASRASPRLIPGQGGHANFRVPSTAESFARLLAIRHSLFATGRMESV